MGSYNIGQLLGLLLPSINDRRNWNLHLHRYCKVMSALLAQVLYWVFRRICLAKEPVGRRGKTFRLEEQKLCPLLEHSYLRYQTNNSVELLKREEREERFLGRFSKT